MRFRREDGTYDTEGRTTMVAWWNASPDEWEHPSPGSTVSASSAGPGPVVRLGEGDTGACSFAIHFRVPAVPAGDYPIVVIQEAGSRGATLEASLVFHVS